MGDSSYYILYVTLFFLSIVLLRNLLRRPSKSVVHGRPPPSPPALPLIGHLHYFSPYVSKSFHNLVTRYGDLLFLRLGNIRCLVVASAAYAEEIYKTQDVTFSSRPKFAFGDELPYANAGFFGAEYGGYWRFMKKLTMTELLSQRQVERSRGVRRDEMVKFLVKLAECGERNDAVDLGAELIRLANNSICRLLMSTRCCGNDDEAETIRTLIRETMEVATKVSFGNVFGGPLEKLAFWLFGRQVRDLTLRYDEILEKDLLLGGTGTSTEVAQWVMSELLNHPKVFNKLRNEIDSVVGTTKLVGEDDVPNLPYLQAVVKETLRLYPAVPIAMRACRQDCKINGFDVPKDTMVAVNLFAIMRDPKVWKNPNEFDPKRFTGEERYEIKGQQSFKFVPFGGGRRACPGSTLAFGFISTVVAAMVQCFDWKIGRNGDESKVDMEIGAAFTLPRANPLLCVPVLRFDPSSLATTTC
ncbi:Cytochrome P450 705A20, partial [Cucurbita argyrosperma subsp. sororia]